MVKLKKQFKTIYFCFISFIAILFTINNHQLMAMENDKNKQKNNFDIFEEVVEQFSEGIEYFNKKGIQINLNKITKLLSQNEKRKQKNEEKSINSKNNKKMTK
ncbi:SVM family protein ['Fragaria x ananassa' phyllody phytoplasma]|uniref:SVM family protein n=1 Tax='Fragaria x ananassa' phyllody phytoplasma TaxID=2358428 RepID=A0ABS5K2Q6_9MOLU|nr:SVM family protein ['Fragaria x ananassa' phyllody phytoplasma]MBS2126154.1 SVM family protein ['Fragaria x ananassa' phyllody phytoplasma]